MNIPKDIYYLVIRQHKKHWEREKMEIKLITLAYGDNLIVVAEPK